MSISSVGHQLRPRNACSRPEAGAVRAFRFLASASGFFGVLAVLLLMMGARSASGQILRETTFKVPRCFITQLAFAPDGKTFASISTDYVGRTAGYVRLWDIKTGKEKAKFRLATPSCAYLLAFTPDSKTLVSSCGRTGLDGAGFRRIEVWDVKAGKRRKAIDLSVFRGDLGAILADGKTLVVTARDASVALYNLDTGKELAVLAGHKDVKVLTVSKDGKWLATGCDKGKLGIWDLDKRKLLYLFDAQEGGVTALAFSPDGKFIASDGRDVTLNLWERSTSNREAKVDHRTRFGQVRFLSFTPDGRAVVLAGLSWGEGICWWEVTGGKFRGAIDPDTPGKPSDHRCAAMSPDGKFLVTAYNRGIQLWGLREKPKAP